MWSLVVAIVLGVSNLGAITHWMPANQSNTRDPLSQLEQLMNSENLRLLHEDRHRFYPTNEQPSQLTPYRVHGGVGPASGF